MRVALVLLAVDELPSFIPLHERSTSRPRECVVCFNASPGCLWGGGVCAGLGGPLAPRPGNSEGPPPLDAPRRCPMSRR